MTSRRDIFFLLGCSVLLILLWLPGVRYPIVSDTAIYALTGESVWQGDGYRLFGELYTKHLPLHAVVSYPFVALLGPQLGMKVSSLLAGMGVLAAAFVLLRKTMGRTAGLLAVFFLTLHPGLILMTMLGSADLLFAALFLASVIAFLRAAEDRRWYVVAGIAAGLACLTRHNGLPLFILFPLATVIWRRHDLWSLHFWIGMALGALLPAAWMLRAYGISGSIVGVYTDELRAESDGRIAQLLSNIVYYANPIHNVFPFLFPFAVYGVARYARRYPFLTATMVTGWLLAAVWWVQAIRFAFPGYPILLGFAALGVRDLRVAARRWKFFALAAGMGAFVVLHGLSLCLYTYGACNAAFDRMIGVVPKDMHLSSEGFHTWSVARDWLNTHAEPNAVVVVDDFLNEATWKVGVFRDDLRVQAERRNCPFYRIDQRPRPGEDVLFTTDDIPHTSVVLQRCL